MGMIRVIDTPSQAIDFTPQRIVHDPGLLRIRDPDHLNVIVIPSMRLSMMPMVERSPGIGADGAEIAGRFHA